VEKPGVLDRAGGPGRERLGEGDVLRLEAPAGFAVDERQDAGHPAGRDQWDEDRRPELDGPQELAVTIVDRRRVHLLGGDVRHVLGVAVAEDCGGAVRRVRVGRIVARGLQRQREQLRIAMGDRDPAGDALVGDLDDAPVGEGRDHEVGHGLDGLLIVERRREHLAGAGEKLLAALRGDPLRDVRDRLDDEVDTARPVAHRACTDAVGAAVPFRVLDREDVVADRLAAHRPAERPILGPQLAAVLVEPRVAEVGGLLADPEPDVGEAASRVVDEEQMTVGIVDEDHTDRHVAEDGLEPVLGLPALVGQLPQPALALAESGAPPRSAA
jgi:hypothetical protein